MTNIEMSPETDASPAPGGVLGGTVAFITGGTRGIGAAISKSLAADGADVAVTYVANESAALSLIDQIHSLGRRAIALKVDSADFDAVQQAVVKAHAEFGRLDILVNCAGVMLPGPIDAYPLANFERSFNINVRGAFAAIQQAVKYLGWGGRIINIGSIITKSVPPRAMGVATYAMTKGALITYTRALARELGPRGITVNIVHPGPTNTDAIKHLPPEFLKSSLANCAIAEFSNPEEIGALVAFIASPSAQHMTGAEFTMDSGVGL
jgi:NAD(P)-dependent dehydrogenase (short-subunit alcohol dehydrogenase family)